MQEVNEDSAARSSNPTDSNPYVLVFGHVALQDGKHVTRIIEQKLNLPIVTCEDSEAISRLSENWHERCALIWVEASFKCGAWLETFLEKRRCLILGFGTQGLLDIVLSSNCNADKINRSLIKAIEFFHQQIDILSLQQSVKAVTEERRELSAIGAALSAEKDLDKLLSMVLEEGRKLGQCEGASLYLLLKEEGKQPELVFKLTQNSVIDFEFKESRFPLTNQSLAGYVALTGETLNIPDAHQIDADAPYQFDDRFDQLMNYRCRELLVLPMKNHREKIIGVLQFINRIKPNKNAQGFSEDTCDLLNGLASQAAVAIDNSQLIENIHQLFEGFVSASVKAIESRDPVTSGHSFRVAELTTGLAELMSKESQGPFREFVCSSQELREIRYASLLHDFGKVGVKENVLLKSNKLSDDRLKYLLLKIQWQKQFLQNQFYVALSQALAENPRNVESAEWKKKESMLQIQLRELEQYAKILEQSNVPTVLENEVAAELDRMASYRLADDYPFQKDLLSSDDFLALSVRKGSLTEQERQEIQSHVVHTREFLSQIPWTDELAGIPMIAGAHHEKLDGSGYPLGLNAEKIPVPSKMMTIADIFDALTASDRPYKRAMPVTIALDILCEEAKKGKVDKSMLDTFIQSRVYRRVVEES